MSAFRSARDGAGMATPEGLVGVLLALVAVLGALGAARGLQRLGVFAMAGADQSLAASWALERMAREIARAGLGVCPESEPACPDEAIEFLDAGALAVRGDLDGDEPAEAAAPETLLAGRFPLVPTANDEVTVYLIRGTNGPASGRVQFEADLDSTDRVTLPDGSVVARRDGVVETIDAGPADSGALSEAGTLYRVTFVNDARYAGTSRFRVVEPLLDDVVELRVEARGADGQLVPDCGGQDDSAGRQCRAQVRRVVLGLVVVDASGRRRAAHREVALLGPGAAGP